MQQNRQPKRAVPPNQSGPDFLAERRNLPSPDTTYYISASDASTTGRRLYLPHARRRAYVPGDWDRNFPRAC